MVLEKKMKQGEAIIFDSQRTPHTAIDIHPESNRHKTRSSLEIRCLLVLKK